MAKPMQMGCKKCGGVVSIEMHPFSDRLDLRIQDGRLHDRMGTIEILCKKCGKTVAMVGIVPAK